MNWTLFPPMTLRGIDTPLVEALDYYFVRLSVTCASTPLSLQKRIASYDGNAPIARCSMLHSRPFVDALQRFTSASDLRCGTFLTFQDAFSIRGWASQHRRWCPVCYHQWNDDCWEPLVWRMPFLARCPEHQVPMASQCHCCGAFQCPYSPYKLRRRCRACKNPLGFLKRWPSPSPMESWIDSILLELTGMCGDPVLSAIPRQNLEALKTSVLENPHLANRAHDVHHLRRRLAAGTYAWRNLKTIVNLCAMQSVRPRLLLLNPEQACSPVLFPEFKQDDGLPISVLKPAKGSQTLKVLESLLEQHDAPLLPLQLTLNFLDTAPSTPKLRAIVKRYAAIENELAWPRSKLARKTIRSALHVADIRPIECGTQSFRKVARFIAQLHGASHSLARQALAGAIQLVASRDEVRRTHRPTWRASAW